MSVEEKTSILTEVYPTCSGSARAIAEAVSKVIKEKITRNSIISLWHRHEHLRTAMPLLGKRCRPSEDKKNEPKMHLKPPRVIQKKITFAPVEPVAPSSPPPMEMAPLKLSLLELTDATCRFPTTMGGRHLFCGHQTDGKSSYCAFHHQLAYEKPVYQPRKHRSFRLHAHFKSE